MAFLGIFNSMTFDFLVRTHMSGGSMKAWIPSQCAAPAPSTVPTDLSALATRLSLTSTSVAHAMALPATEWDEASRERSDAQADALAARTYGLTLAEYELVLNHFKLLEKIETREVGEYRSKRLRLEEFEKIGGGR